MPKSVSATIVPLPAERDDYDIYDSFRRGAARRAGEFPSFRARRSNNNSLAVSRDLIARRRSALRRCTLLSLAEDPRASSISERVYVSLVLSSNQRNTGYSKATRLWQYLYSSRAEYTGPRYIRSFTAGPSNFSRFCPTMGGLSLLRGARGLARCLQERRATRGCSCEQIPGQA